MDEVVIEAGRGFKNYWTDLWRYRELFYFLAWRDILVRYKQTIIGIAWALIRPFLTMVVFTIVFNKIAKFESPGSIPYPLLVFAAMLPWQFFSTALSESSNSLIGNANLISKVYFPRLIIPAGSVITSFVDFLITLGLMAAMMVWFGFLPDWRVITLLPFIALAFGSACEIPGFPICDSLYCPVWPLHFSCWVHQRQHSSTMAPALRLQSDGRRHRRVPLGPSSWRARSLVAKRFDLCGSDHCSLPFRHLVLPADGEDLCGRHLNRRSEVRPQRISKKQ